MADPAYHVRDNEQTCQREWYVHGKLAMTLWRESLPSHHVPLEEPWGTYPDVPPSR